MTFNISPTNILRKTIPILLFISILVKINADLYYYSNAIYPSWSSMRHILVVVIIGISFIVYIGLPVDNRGKWKKPMTIALGFAISYLVISVFMAVRLNKSFTRAIEMSFLQTSSIILAFFFINIFSKKEISRLMRAIFILLTVQYIISHLDSLLVPQNFLEISFFDSYSPFESSAFSGYIYGMLIYFTMFDENKFFIYASFIMNFLVFKRINVLVSIFLVIFGRKISYEKNISNSLKWFVIILFTILPIIQYHAMLGSGIDFILQIFPSFDVQGLLMGRDWFLNTLLNSNYESYGLGSSGTELYSLLTHTGIELDGIVMYLEMGLYGLFGASFTWWNFTEMKLKNFVIILIFMVNYLTSSQLIDTYAVFFNLITVALITNYGRLDEKEEQSVDYALEYQM